MLPFHDKLLLKLPFLFPILPWKEVASTNRMKEDFNRDPRVSKLDDITPAKVFSSYPTKVRSFPLPCHSVTKFSCWVELSCYKLFFVKFVTWIFLSCYMDLSKLFYAFRAVCQTKEGWQRFQSLLNHLLWSKGGKWVKYSMSLVRCVVGNV